MAEDCLWRMSLPADLFFAGTLVTAAHGAGLETKAADYGHPLCARHLGGWGSESKGTT
jgi:hypothetical protein